MLYDEWGNEVDNIIKPIEYVCDEFWEEYCEWENVNILDVPSKYDKSFTQIRPINLEQFYSC
jgi:GTPase SAR1 family protein